MSHDPDRHRDKHSTRRTYLSRAGGVLGATGLGMGALGSASAHEERDGDHEKKESKDENDNNGNETGEKKDDLFLTHLAELDGKNEVPAVETDAKGAAGFVVTDCEKEVRFILAVEDLCNVTQAHIHVGEKGENGPVIVWLYPQETREPELIDGRFDGTLAQGVFTEKDFTTDFEDVEFGKFVERMDDKGLYVNVHTEQNPSGEIRGQIRRAKTHDGGPVGGTT